MHLMLAILAHLIGNPVFNNEAFQYQNVITHYCKLRCDEVKEYLAANHAMSLNIKEYHLIVCTFECVLSLCAFIDKLIDLSKTRIVNLSFVKFCGKKRTMSTHS